MPTTDAPADLGRFSIDELIEELARRFAEADWLQHRAGSHVEILESWSSHPNASPAEDLPCIKPSVVRIDGVPVGLIPKGGIHVDPGDGVTPASVTLTLHPRAVTIKAE